MSQWDLNYYSPSNHKKTTYNLYKYQDISQINGIQRYGRNISKKSIRGMDYKRIFVSKAMLIDNHFQIWNLSQSEAMLENAC